MLKFLKRLFFILLFLFIVITCYGAINFFKEQYNNKKVNANNYIIYDRNDKSNIDKIKDGFSNLYNNNFGNNDNNNNDNNSNNGSNNIIGNNDGNNDNDSNESSNGNNGNGSNDNNSSNNSDTSSSSTNDEAKNINKQYDTYNFDNSLLLYEGENKGKSIITLLDKLLNNSNNNLYTNTTITIKNLGSLDKTISYSYKDNNIEEYKNNLEEVKNNIISEDIYIVSFGYSKRKTHVNEIIIEKK